MHVACYGRMRRQSVQTKKWLRWYILCYVILNPSKTKKSGTLKTLAFTHLSSHPYLKP